MDNQLKKAKRKEKFSNSLIEQCQNEVSDTYCGYFRNELEVPNVVKNFLPSLAYDLPGYDSVELQTRPCL